MKWEGNRESDHMEDRRDDDGSSGRGGLGKRSLGIGSIAIALVASYFFGVNPMMVLDLLSGGNPMPQTQQIESPKAQPHDIMAKFVSTVLADTEDVWTNVFAQSGATYKKPTLVLFRGATPTRCGQGQAAKGRFIALLTRRSTSTLSFMKH